MLIPVRKCYQIIKLTAIVIIVVGVLSMFEHWRGGSRNVGADDISDPEEEFFERQIKEDEARIIPGLGAGGEPVTLTGQDKILGKRSEKELAMNVYLSDRIPYNRTLKDYRNPMCQRVIYDAELPSASVIIIFHNEPYSVVVRTLWSVINSARRDQPWYKKANYIDRKTGKKMKLGYPDQDPDSPFVYLKEIILVDDNSTLPELQGKLSHYIRTRLPPDMIKILRLPERIGLTRARLAGAKFATGSVLLFLDAHCEVQPDWLRPQLQRIKDSPHAVLVPIIDVINRDDFYYSVQNNAHFQPKYEQTTEWVNNLTAYLLKVIIKEAPDSGYLLSKGLMRARVEGAKIANSTVLVFLDAHCEALPDWLRPQLQRIKNIHKSVTIPIIDWIRHNTFEYHELRAKVVGGFAFTGHFTWIDVPEREKARRGSDIAPTWSPTMAGGLFAMDRSYYWELGAYDEQMNGWGGENLEISFRIWQCGGTLETVPCSRVGHVFRSFHPYSLPASSDTHGINTARMAEVWMDDYKELFYLHRPDLRKNPKIGDITHRKVLREKLRCKSFQWYLDNIYKEKFVPVRDAIAYGRVVNPSSNLCLDTLQQEAERSPLGVYACHETLQATQYFSLSTSGELRDEEKCAEILFTNDEKRVNEARKVLMSSCTGKGQGQKWRYLEGGVLQHVESGLCLSGGWRGGEAVWGRPCTDSPTMKWNIDFNQDNDFRGGTLFSAEQEETLRRLRGQRRKSRSLMSVESLAPRPPRRPAHRRHRPHSGHRRKKGHDSRRLKRKNKFILRAERMLPNGSMEHLEMELLCRHRKLYPNDTFVRDIVTVLNDNNIRVINNGRVFERHGLRSDPKSDTTLRSNTYTQTEKLSSPPPDANKIIVDNSVMDSPPTINQVQVAPVPKQRQRKKVTKKSRFMIRKPKSHIKLPMVKGINRIEVNKPEVLKESPLAFVEQQKTYIVTTGHNNNKAKESKVERGGQNTAGESNLEKDGQNTAKEDVIERDSHNTARVRNIDRVSQNIVRERNINRDGQNTARESNIERDGQNTAGESNLERDGQYTAGESNIERDSHNTARERIKDRVGQNTARERNIDRVGQNTERERNIDRDGQNTARERNIDRDGQNTVRDRNIVSDIHNTAIERIIERDSYNTVRESNNIERDSHNIPRDNMVRDSDHIARENNDKPRDRIPLDMSQYAIKDEPHLDSRIKKERQDISRPVMETDRDVNETDTGKRDRNVVEEREYYDDASDQFSDFEYHRRSQSIRSFVTTHQPVLRTKESGRRSDIDKSKVTPVGWSPEEAVRLVLRSNLTFNLGDEFFNNLQLAQQSVVPTQSKEVVLTQSKEKEVVPESISELALARSSELPQPPKLDSTTKAQIAKDRSVSSAEDTSSYSDTHEVD